ncbi:MAG: zinc ribbon domain-containing protein [Acetatifactor sp.]|nr:zinc ribbon domain-containing protein [Acetatifactor sp.]
MTNLQLEIDEGILLESDSSSWLSNEDYILESLVLTNKHLYCVCEKSNGIFKGYSHETITFLISEIKIINGQALVKQIKIDGRWCLQIQFNQSIEYFEFYEVPKKIIPTWVSEINKVLGIEEISEPTNGKETKSQKSVRVSSFFVSKNLKQANETAKEADLLGESQAIQEVKQDIKQEIKEEIKQELKLEEKSEDNLLYCIECGSKLCEGTNYCPECGRMLVPGKKHIFSDKGNAVTCLEESVDVSSEQKQQSDAERSQSNKQEEYVGKVFKCPNCGDIIDSFTLICPSCGVELRGIEASKTLHSFMLELKNSASDREKAAIIGNFPVPNTKEDIYEFFVMASSSVLGENSEVLFDAWNVKMNQCYQKANLSINDEAELDKIQRIYDSTCKQLEKKRSKLSVNKIISVIKKVFSIFPNPIVAVVSVFLVIFEIERLIRLEFNGTDIIFCALILGLTYKISSKKRK